MKNKPGMYANKSDMAGQQSSAAAIEDFDPLEYIAEKTLSKHVSMDKYSPEDKFMACFEYFMAQNMKKVHQKTGIPEATLNNWKNKSAWWKDVYAFIKRAKNEEMDGFMSGAMEMAMTELVDRLMHGDEVLDKFGNPVRKRMSGKDAATILAILFDKRALLRGDPSTNMNKESTDSLLKQLGDAFTKKGKNTPKTDEKEPESAQTIQ